MWRAMPLVPLALAFAVGVAVAPSAAPHALVATWLAATAATVVMLQAAGVEPGARRMATASLLAAVAATGALRAQPAPPSADSLARLPLPLAADVEGRLVQEPIRWTDDRTRLHLIVERVDGAARSGTLPLTVYGPLAVDLAQGQRIRVAARLYHPTGYRNPGVFDATAALARHGIVVTATARAESVAPLTPPTPPWNGRIRRAARAAIDAALPPVSAALLRGLVLGDRADLPDDVNETFRQAGVVHILAVSGFNVALLAGATWALLSVAALPRRITALACMVVVAGYAAVAGLEPSVARATVMALLVLGAIVIERESSVANGLAAAALIILAVRPAELYDPGFQLSFAATIGIVAMPMPRGRLAGAVAVSAGAQLAVAPISVSHFNQVSVVGVLANLAVVPLAALSTLLGAAAVLLASIADALARPLFDAAWPALLALRLAAAAAATVPYAAVHAPAPPPLAIGCYAIAAVGARLAWRARGDARPLGPALWFGAAAFLAVSLLLWTAPVRRTADGRLRVVVLDVGQGDAIAIHGPDGRTVVVDAGPGGGSRLDAGARVVAPYLWNAGTLRLAAVAVTHDDADHAGGMSAVRRLFAPREVWRPGVAPAGPWALGGATLTAIAGSAEAGNDAGLVLRVELGLVSFLLAADIEWAGEHALVARGTPLAATVLKVAHHGSRTSTTPAFVAAVRPAVALISVGSRNAYGHPHADVLARLVGAGARIHRTDRDGALLLETDGRRLAVTRWASRTTETFCVDPDTLC